MVSGNNVYIAWPANSSEAHDAVAVLAKLAGTITVSPRTVLTCNSLSSPGGNDGPGSICSGGNDGPGSICAYTLVDAAVLAWDTIMD